MAKPTDPAKLAKYRAGQAAAQRRYQARQKAARLGVAAPKAARLQQPARYRPPRVGGAVERARATRNQQTARRREIIGNLPDIRNDENRVNIRPGEETARGLPARKSKAGQARQAAAFREQSASQRIKAVGRARKEQLLSELENGAQSDRLKQIMSPSEQREFQHYSEIIAAGSQQSVAILFDHIGGQGDYSSALEFILKSIPDVDTALGKLAALAEIAQRAARAYSPKAIGEITV